MNRKFVLLLVTALAIFGVSKTSYAMTCDMHGEDSSKSCPGQTQAASNAQSVNAGNKTCPVTGEKIDEATKAAYEYKGKIYNLCCPACISTIKKDPEKYIANTEQAAGGERPIPEGHNHGQ
ncbi:MAG: YHS domain-containing protein [Candidatus Omnitrophota bacterium]|nr:YHS domain-containing protein [Candidatus Omnitrophota bacterium]